MKGSKGFLILVVVIIAIPVIYFILKGKNQKSVISKQNKDKNDNIFTTFFDQPIKYLKNKKINKPVKYNKKDIDTRKTINVINAERLINMGMMYLFYDDTEPESNKKYEFKNALVTLNDADKKLLEDYFYDQKVYVKNMSERDKLLLSTYIVNGYSLYNRFLRQEEDIVDGEIVPFEDLYRYDTSLFDLENPRKTMNNLSKELNQLILNSPRLPVQLTTFRASKDPYYFKDLESVINERGETEYIYTSPSFLSTALGLGRNTSLKSEFLNKEQTCCLSLFYLPKDTRGLYIFSGGETELLLPLYSRLKYLGEKQISIDELQKFINYQSLDYPDLKNILNRSPTITVYEWEYLSPVSDTYVELYRYRDMY